MNEHSFIKAVHRKLPSDVYRWKIHDTYTGGVPDTWYAGPAGTLFVEYKYIQNLPKRPTTEVKSGLSALQIAWLDRMWDYKVVVAVIIGSKVGSLILSDQEWHKVLKPQDFETGLKPPDIADWLCAQVLYRDSDHGNDNPETFDSRAGTNS